jgi:hypothetical protein
MPQKYTAIVKSDTLANGASIYMQIITAATGIVKVNGIVATSSDVTVLSIVEAPTITNGTTAVSLMNRNRNADMTPTTLLYSDPTSISAGTEIDRQIVGAGGGSGITVALDGDPLILKQGTKYLCKLTNSTGSAVQAQIRLSIEEAI